MKNFILLIIFLSGALQTALANQESINTQSFDEPSFFNANKAAFLTTTSLAALTIASTVGAANASRVSNTFGLVSYSILAITSAAASLGAVSAWMNLGESTDANNYFEKVGEYVGIAIAGVYQFTAQVLVMSLVQGLTQGISRSVSRSIGGEDQTIRIVR